MYRVIFNARIILFPFINSFNKSEKPKRNNNDMDMLNKFKHHFVHELISFENPRLRRYLNNFIQQVSLTETEQQRI